MPDAVFVCIRVYPRKSAVNFFLAYRVRLEYEQRDTIAISGGPKIHLLEQRGCFADTNDCGQRRSFAAFGRVRERLE